MRLYQTSPADTNESNQRKKIDFSEQCSRCGENTLVRCGTLSKCYSPLCNDDDPFKTD